MSVTSARPEARDPGIRRVVAASLVGTTVEWYDFFVYAAAAGLVFSELFFPALDPTTGLLVSFATLGVSFVARPVGGIVAGHLGDRVGRKAMLVATLLLMGVATVGVGLLPTYATLGAAAPVLLVVLRLLQGLSAGGEWGGAALMAVEHAPPGRRGYFGAYPQVGVPAGLLLANLVFLVVTSTTSEAQFLAWGWRLPFLLSIVLVGVGLFVRYRVAESPVFLAMRAVRSERSAPLGVVVRRHKRTLALATAIFIAVQLVGYILIAFINSYGTRTLRVPTSTVLGVGMIGAVCWVASILVAGAWSDRVGRRTVYLWGSVVLALWVFPFFLLFDTASPPMMVLAVVGLAVGLGLTYGQQAATYAELFPAPVRYSGASLAYAFGAILGGGFAPAVATWLVEVTGTSLAVSGYMLLGALVTLLAALAMPDPGPEVREAIVLGREHPRQTEPGTARSS